jgi:hypothetical protein
MDEGASVATGTIPMAGRMLGHHIQPKQKSETELWPKVVFSVASQTGELRLYWAFFARMIFMAMTSVVTM